MEEDYGTIRGTANVYTIKRIDPYTCEYQLNVLNGLDEPPKAKTQTMNAMLAITI